MEEQTILIVNPNGIHSIEIAFLLLIME